MKRKKATLIRQLHVRIMKKFKDRIGESINQIEVAPELSVDENADDPELAGQDVNSLDKINALRHKVAASQDLVITNPDKQKELLDILKKAYQEFRRELRNMMPGDNRSSGRSTEKFKEELLTHAKNKLAEKKHSLELDNLDH